jgi:hypothetical protein
MSGVAKDDPTSTPGSDEAVAVKEAEEAASPETTTTSEEPRARRAAPHLRVVGEDEEVAPTAEPGLPPQRIGAVMRATRENLGLTLDQVSKETRVHLSHLRAVEDMTPNLLGAPVYAKGYIRAYARHLGMDEMGTLERYLRECAILKDPEKQEIAPPTTGRKLPTAVPVLGFLVLGLAVAAGAYFVINNRPSETPPASVATAPTAATPTVPSILADNTANAVAAYGLHIVAVKPGHLEVRSAAGDKIIDRDFYPGDRPAVPRLGAGWTVSASDGSAFEWRLGDKSLGLLKADGPCQPRPWPGDGRCRSRSASAGRRRPRGRSARARGSCGRARWRPPPWNGRHRCGSARAYPSSTLGLSRSRSHPSSQGLLCSRCNAV